VTVNVLPLALCFLN